MMKLTALERGGGVNEEKLHEEIGKPENQVKSNQKRMVDSFI